MIRKIVSVCIAVVAVGLIAWGIILGNSSIYIFTNALTKTFNNYIEESTNTESIFALDDMLSKDDAFKITTKTSINGKNSESFQLNGDIYVDGEDEKAYVDIEALLGDSSKTAMKALLDDDKIYFKVNELMDEFYYITFEKTDINVDEYADIYSSIKKNLLTYFKEVMINNLNENDFEKSNETITINNDKLKTEKLKTTYTQKELITLLIDLMNKVKDDKQIVSLVDTILLASGEESMNGKLFFSTLISSLTAEKDQMKDDEEVLNYITYIYDNKIVKHEITSPDKSEDKINITLIDYTNIKGKRYFEIDVTTQGETVLNFKKVGTDKEAYIDITIDDAHLKGNVTKDNSKVALSIDVLDSKGVKLGNFKYTIETITKNSEYKITINFDIDGEDGISLTSINNLYIGVAIPNVDVKDGKNFNDLTESEMTEFKEKFQEKFGTELDDFDTDSLLSEYEIVGL